MTDDGTVWCCGFNLEGQLGDGTTTDRDYPVQVSSITDAVDIYVGMSTARAAVNQRKDLKCWGDNFVGDGSSTDSATPVNVGMRAHFVAFFVPSVKPCPAHSF